VPELVNPHDKFFKEALTQPEAARDFLRYYLPAEVATLLDLTDLRLVKDAFVDETLQEHFADLLYEVRLLDGRDAYVYVLFEHKSCPESVVALQLVYYMMQVWEYAMRERGWLRAVAPIVPMVVSRGKVRWTTPLHFGDLLNLPKSPNPAVPDYRGGLHDLSECVDADLRGAVAVEAVLVVLRHPFRADTPERSLDALGLLCAMAQQKTALGCLEALLRHLSPTTETLPAQDLWNVMEEMVRLGDAIRSTCARSTRGGTGYRKECKNGRSIEHPGYQGAVRR